MSSPSSVIARQPLYGARASEFPKIVVFTTALLQNTGILCTAKAGKGEDR